MMTRFLLFHQTQDTTRPNGVTVLRLADNHATRQTFTRIRDSLAKVA
jgi:hypothetical protein